MDNVSLSVMGHYVGGVGALGAVAEGLQGVSADPARQVRQPFWPYTFCVNVLVLYYDGCTLYIGPLVDHH